jgi:peptidoglycan/xylan/chitin deacetylase (PgdA/CDA1 family)
MSAAVKAKAYLTIDDSPSGETDALCDFLTRENVPAILFCRGDRMESDAGPAVRAIRNGFVIGNHAYAHRRASRIGFAETTAEIARTDLLIDAAYSEAGVARPGKYFRFPHMDRGAGGWVVDYDSAGDHRPALVKLFGDGLNVSLDPPGDDLKKLKADLQDWLRAQGFTRLPFGGVTHPWYADTEMNAAIDAMFTFSTSDWMITPRHAGRWPYKTPDDLIRKIDDDPWLGMKDSAHIILTHDQDGMLPVTQALVRHMKKTLDFAAL